MKTPDTTIIDKDKILQSHSPEETLKFGIDFALQLKPGDVVTLTGVLGAGKTLFARGICRGLGFEGDVTSPSYVHIHRYNGYLPIHHADLYLDQSIDSVLDLGLDELIDSMGIVLIEWADRFPEILPAGHWSVEIKWVADKESERSIEISKIKT